MGLQKCEDLCEHLANDPRIPDAKIVVSTSSLDVYGNHFLKNHMVIPLPFSLADIEKTYSNANS
jgi:hypothetical protein